MTSQPTTSRMPPEPDRTPREEMHQAVMGDHTERVAELLALDPGLAAGGDDFSPVLISLYRGRHEALELLLEARQPVSFFEAVALGAAELVHRACASDAALVRAYDQQGYTALHLAAFFGRTEVMRALLDAGANIDALSQNDEEATPLHAAAGALHRGACALLIQRGALVDAQQARGFTPLHLVSRYGDEGLAQLLVVSGADPAREADNGKTPADLAYEFEHDHLADYLRMHRR